MLDTPAKVVAYIDEINARRAVASKVAEASVETGTILAVLDHHDVEYVLVGGLGARAHGAVRPTSDIDCVPKADSSTWVGSLMRSASSVPDSVSVE